jgi:hypothetical protein
MVVLIAPPSRFHFSMISFPSNEIGVPLRARAIISQPSD